jgi:NADPH:quinone reductase-like Zn-dependent oxidoreductase
MKAIVYNKFGNLEVLQTIEEVKPTIKSNQVLVKVKAVSINPMDWKIRKGEMKLVSGSKFPKHTGVDFSGIIEAVGTSVPNFKKGDEIFGIVNNTMKDGASAEYLAVNSTSVWKKPSTISFSQAASVPIVGAAAVMAFEKMGNINAQSNILINGTTGGFGMFLLQLLKSKEANVTAVTNSNSIEVAKSWGANTVIDYNKVNVLTQQTAYDIIVDLSGKMGYKNAKQIMKPKALFINPTPQPIEIPTSLFKNPFTGKKHVVMLSAPTEKNIHFLLNSINNGLQVEVNKTFRFSQTKEAYQYAEKGGIVGKVTIEME